MSRIEFTVEYSLRVVVYPAPDVRGQWIAHGLETDIVTQGDSPEHALAMATEALETLGHYRIAHGFAPLVLRPAPKEVWDLVATAKPIEVVARVAIRPPRTAGKRRAVLPNRWPIYAFVSATPPAMAHAG